MQLSHAEMELYVERAAVVAALGEQLLRAAANVRETFVSRRGRRAPCALSAGMCGLVAAAANRPMRLRRAALSLTDPGTRVPGSTRQYPAVPSSTRQYQSTALICIARRLSPLGAVDYCCAYCRALQCVPWVNSGSVGSGPLRSEGCRGKTSGYSSCSGARRRCAIIALTAVGARGALELLLCPNAMKPGTRTSAACCFVSSWRARTSRCAHCSASGWTSRWRAALMRLQRAAARPHHVRAGVACGSHLFLCGLCANMPQATQCFVMDSVRYDVQREQCHTTYQRDKCHAPYKRAALCYVVGTGADQGWFLPIQH
jgi:hypothetical protein